MTRVMQKRKALEAASRFISSSHDYGFKRAPLTDVAQRDRRTEDPLGPLGRIGLMFWLFF